MTSTLNQTFSSITNIGYVPNNLNTIPSSGTVPSGMKFLNPKIKVTNTGLINYISEGPSQGGVSSLTSLTPDTLIISDPSANTRILNPLTSVVSESSNTLVQSSDIASYIDSKVSSGPLTYKGGYDSKTNSPNLTVPGIAITKGSSYTVIAAGTFYTDNLEIGDLLIAELDIGIGNGSLASWTVIQNNVHSATTSVLGIVSIDPDGGFEVSTAGALYIENSNVAPATYELQPSLTINSNGLVTLGNEQQSLCFSSAGLSGIGSLGSNIVPNSSTTAFWASIVRLPDTGSNKIEWFSATNEFNFNAAGWYRITFEISFHGTSTNSVSSGLEEDNIELIGNQNGSLALIAKEHGQRPLSTVGFPTSNTISFDRILLFPSISSYRYFFKLSTSFGNSTNVILNSKENAFSIEYLRAT